MTTDEERADFIQRIDDQLAGSYTPKGVHDWWGRPRTQLDGLAPCQLFTGDWEPDDEGPQRVLTLALSLNGPMCT